MSRRLNYSSDPPGINGHLDDDTVVTDGGFLDLPDGSTVKLRVPQRVEPGNIVVEPGYVTLFQRNYVVDSENNVGIYNWAADPTNNQMFVTKVPEGVSIGRLPTGTDYGMIHVYGFAPMSKCRYRVRVKMVNSSFTAYIGGCSFSIAQSGEWFNVAGMRATTKEVEIVVDTDNNGKSCAVYMIAGGVTQGPVTLAWMSQRGYKTEQFSPPSIAFRPAVGSSLIIINVSQEVYVTEIATSVGSNIHQGFGDDGPRWTAAADMVSEGFTLLRSLGMGGTIFADITYVVLAATKSFYQDLLDNYPNWDLGIHYRGVYAMVDSEYSQIATMFGMPPLSWTVLGSGWFSTDAENNSVVDRYGQNRAELCIRNMFGSTGINDNNREYWLNASKAGYVSIPSYCHNIDDDSYDYVVSPKSGDLHKTLFTQWVNDFHVHGGKIVGYWHWYMMHKNIKQASFVVSQGSGYVVVQANTNGYNTMVLLKIPDVTSITRGGSPVNYRITHGGYVLLEMEPGENYTLWYT